MKRTIPILLAVLSFGSCTRPDAASLAGEYRRAHRVFVFHGNEPVELDAEDRLVLEGIPDGSLRFSIHLTTVGGETCAVEGIARPSGDAFEYRPADVDGCVLQILRTDSEILIEDVEEACGVEYCGDRAAIGRLAFPGSQTAPRSAVE